MGENTVAALMREQGLAARRKKKRKGTTRPGKGRWRTPDLVRRDFPATQINKKWYGDGTEIPADEGKLYLASVLDMASRRILGFSLGEHYDAAAAYGALTMAVAMRGGQVPGVILRTDQGSEYTAGTIRAACGRLGIRQSMGRPGSALDNAVIESWHSTLEFELRALEHFATREQARVKVAAWISQPEPAALRAGDDVPGELRKSAPGREGGLTWLPLLHCPVSAGARLRPGRSSSALTGLRGLHLDTACAPAVTWQLSEAGLKAISAQLTCPRFQGNPGYLTGGPAAGMLSPLTVDVRDYT